MYIIPNLPANHTKKECSRFDLHKSIYIPSIYSFNLKAINDDKVLTVNIESFAPLSGIVRKSQVRTIQQLIDNSKKLHEKPNLYSVGVLIKFTINSNSLSVCLTGDVDNTTIESMHPKNKL